MQHPIVREALKLLDPPFSQIGVFPVTSINVMNPGLLDLFTELGRDELSALNVLYPVPKPGLALLGLTVAMVAGSRRRVAVGLHSGLVRQPLSDSTRSCVPGLVGRSRQPGHDLGPGE